MNYNELLAKNIKKYRQFLGLSQEALAHKSCLDQSYIGRIERQIVSPTVTTIEKICRAMSVEPSTLFLKDFSCFLNDYTIIRYSDGKQTVVNIDIEDLNKKEKNLLELLCNC